MASDVGMIAKRGIDIPMLQGSLRSKQKELPYKMTRRFRHHDPFVVGDFVWLQNRVHQQSPVNDKVEVIGSHYEYAPALLKFKCSADIIPFWPIESCKLADLEPMMLDYGFA